MMTLGIHCWYLTISLYLIYPGYTLLWWPRVYITGTYLISVPYIPWMHIVMMTLGIHAGTYLYHYTLYTLDTYLYDVPGYIAGNYLYHYSLYTLDTHCYDDPWNTFLVLIYIILPYIPRIHIVMMTLGIHCQYLSISLYLIYRGYTLLWWSWVYIAGTYLYHYTLYTLESHSYDDPGNTL